MGQKLVVGISDWKVGRGDDIIVTYALGSCIGTCLYEKTTGIAGLSHIMLPDSTAIFAFSAGIFAPIAFIRSTISGSAVSANFILVVWPSMIAVLSGSIICESPAIPVVLS